MFHFYSLQYAVELYARQNAITIVMLETITTGRYAVAFVMDTKITMRLSKMCCVLVMATSKLRV